MATNDSTTRTFHIVSKAGQDMGVYEGADATCALAAMHLEAGYDVAISAEDPTRLVFASEDDERLCGQPEAWTIRETIVAGEVDASNVRASETGAGGWDVDVDVGGFGAGEVTLRPSDYNGAPDAWGSPDHWISGDLLRELGRLSKDDFRDACERIAAAAGEAIEASGVEPAKPYSPLGDE